MQSHPNFPTYYAPRPECPETAEPPPPLPMGAHFPDESRPHSELRLITYSGYSRQSANTQLHKHIQSADYESAFYWGAELMGAGHWEDIWDVVVHYASIHVYIGNILLPGYLWARLCTARQICAADKNTIKYRNNDDFRKLIAEVISITIMSKKNPPIPLIRIRRENELKMDVLAGKLEATESYIDGLFRKADPVELKVPVNELVHHLKNSRHNTMHACYWVEWILEFELKCRSNKCPLEIAERSEYDVSSNVSRDVVWLIWDVFKEEVGTDTPVATASSSSIAISGGNNIKQIKQRTLDALLKLFCHNYSRTVAKKRRPILYFVIMILATDEFPEEPLVKDPALWDILQEQLYKTYNTIQETPRYSVNGRTENEMDLAYDKIFIL